METRYFLILLTVAFLLCRLPVEAQSGDSASSPAVVADSSAHARDTAMEQASVTKGRNVFPSGESLDGPYGSRVSAYISKHPVVRADKMPVGLPHLERQVRNMDWVFYLLAGSLLLLGFTRVLFPGYLEDLFQDFFGFAGFQRKKGEGVVRHGVASLWLNLLFLLNGALFLHFLLRPPGPGDLSWKPWQWIGFWMLLLAGLYLVKYAVVLLVGWVIGKVQQAHDYMAIIFQVNRLAAILLLVATLPLALSGDDGMEGYLPFVWFVLAMLLVLRLVRSYGFLRQSQRLGPVQFLLLFLSFELLPLLLIRKAIWDLFL